MKVKEKKCILFCHYGNSPYLIYTLSQVRLSNPESRVILLGDADNKRIAKKTKVEHYYFKDYDNSDEILKFEEVYRHVAGIKHKKEFWTKFVFKRWFYIHDFIKKNDINSFWHFDSDNMIFSSLEQQEYKFRDFDCTEQCNGICMNGYISSFQVVDGYVKKINELFVDNEYLNEQKSDFVRNPDYAFTEMRAYKAYKEQENIKSIRLNEIIGNESFDDCICEEHGYARYSTSLGGRFLKKIYFDDYGNFYCYHLNSSRYIKMNSLNLSWVPVGLFKLIFKKFKKNHTKENFLKEEVYVLLDVFRIKSFSSKLLWFIPKSIKGKVKRMIMNT